LYLEKGYAGRHGEAGLNLLWRGTKTSVTGEGLADVVLTVFSAETAISVMRSVLQRTNRGQMRYD
jgi:hypothetical protein